MRSYQIKSKAFWLCSFFCLSVSVSIEAKTLIFESGQNNTSNSTATQSGQPNQQTARVISTNSIAPSTAASPANAAVAEMYFMVEQLKREVSELRGVVEEQAYRLQGFEEASKRRYKDLDQRLQKLSKPGAETSGTPSSGGVVVAPVAEAKGIVPVKKAAAKPPSDAQKKEYARAYALVKEKRFEDAVDSLHSYIEKYPEGELTGNAYYWLGEVYLVLPQLEQAKQSFLIVVNSFPNHRKLADSVFKLAVTYDRLLDPDNSEKYLKMVQSKFPDSTAAKLAKNYKISR